MSENNRRQKKVSRVSWPSLRQLRWKELYHPLRSYMLSGALPEGLTKKRRRRLIRLRDLLTLDPDDGEIYLHTRTPPPELTDGDGNPIVHMKEPLKLRLVSPDEIEALVLEVYRAPNLGAFRGTTSLYKRLSRQYLGIYQGSMDDDKSTAQSQVGWDHWSSGCSSAYRHWFSGE